MKFQVRNVRGIERADIEAGKIALLAGSGGAGKSSICFAVSAVVTGLPVVGGVKAKSRAGELIRAGNNKGTITVESAKGQADISYPKADYSAAGSPPHASRFAAGAASLPDMDPKKRPPEMSAYIEVDPTKKDLEHHLSDVKVPDNVIDTVWETILDKGWDGSLEKAKERRIQLKALWREVAGEEYGPAKAEQWVPDDWSDSLDSQSLDALSSDLAEAKTALEDAIGKQAVDEDRLNTLREKAKELPDAEKVLAERTKAYDEAVQAHSEALKAAQALPTPTKKLAESTCPECGSVVAVKVTGADSFDLLTIKEDEEDETADIEEQRIKLQNAVVSAQSGVNLRRDDKSGAEAWVSGVKRAIQDLEEMPEGTLSKAEVDKAREVARLAEQRLEAFKRYTKALQHHTSVQTNQKIIDALAQDGVRKTVLLRGLKAFNEEQMEPLWVAAIWPRIVVTPDLSLEYDDRDYDDLSRSEKARSRIILQLAMAMVDGSDVVVIDDLDVLPPSARGGAMQAIVKSGKAAVVSLMTENPGSVPNLSAMGVGHTYWVEGGFAKSLADKLAEGKKAA